MSLINVTINGETTGVESPSASQPAQVVARGVIVYRIEESPQFTDEEVILLRQLIAAYTTT